MKRVHYHKLIRDKIPLQIERFGGEYEVRTLDSEEFRSELYRKLIEESVELIQAGSREEVLKEIGDLEVVLAEIRSLENISDEEMCQALARNFEQKGRFTQRLYLIWSSDTGYEHKK